jgi:hypothetical protein
MHTETVGSWKHEMVTTEWSFHMLIQGERQQQWGGTVELAWQRDSIMVPKWLANRVMAFLIIYSEAIIVLLCCAITMALLLLELLKLKDNWQCSVCLEPTHLGIASGCFLEGCVIANLCGCVVLTGCGHIASDIHVLVLLIADELIQEQNQTNRNGGGGNTNAIMSIQQDSVQFCISFTLNDCCSMCLVVRWKPP